MRSATLAFATTRLALAIACYFCLTFFPAHPTLEWQASLFPGHNWIDGWFRWDSFWYLAIADPSTRAVPQDLSSANFFPLYAWVSLAVALPFRLFASTDHAFAIAGLIVSNAAFLVALIGVHKLTTALAGERAADRAVWLLACFPFSFFLSAVYSDALYLCLAVWAFVFARERRWSAAFALASLASMTRIPGAALVAGVAIVYWQQEGIGRSVRRDGILAAMVLAAPVIVALYFWTRFGDPVAFLHARQVGWQRATGVAALSRDFGEFLSGPAFACGNLKDCFAGWDLTRHVLGAWYVALIPVTLGLVLSASRTVGIGMVTWVVLSVVMAMANGLDGTGRFTSVLFPVFIAAATLVKNRAAVAAICLAFAPFLFLFLFQFARWRPVL